MLPLKEIATSTHWLRVVKIFTKRWKDNYMWYTTIYQSSFMANKHYFCIQVGTVPLKGKLTVTRELRNSTRDILSQSSKISRIESRVDFRNSRVGSFEFRVEKNNELTAWLISREINWTSEAHSCVVHARKPPVTSQAQKKRSS